jgi:hypothetical protein
MGRIEVKPARHRGGYNLAASTSLADSTVSRNTMSSETV